jgi:dTDP-4-dehydrorhamnose 3,5-epimerase
MYCRFCKTELKHVFIDLINSPASNSFLTAEQLNEPEVFYPLKAYTCHNCFLVQVEEYKKSDAIFNSAYVYFSSYSKSWLEHAKRYTTLMVDKFSLNNKSQVVEIASNDGYLLQYFKERDIPVLGIEPTKNTAKVAINKGIDTIIDFFGEKLATELAEKGKHADLLLGNNVLAHVPDLVDFVTGMKILLKPTGIITMEFPHLMQLVDNNEFDTVYHEHFSYLSFYTVKNIFESKGLELFDVDEVSTHGGSLRIYAKHKEDPSKVISPNVSILLKKEEDKGMLGLSYYDNFQDKAFQIKSKLLSFLIEQKKNGKKVAAYGAAAKGNTLLNYCGVKSDLIEYVVDASPYKQNKFLPASHIPVVNEDHLKTDKPDYVIILPWNLKEELIRQLSYIDEWGGKFVIAIPELHEILPNQSLNPAKKQGNLIFNKLELEGAFTIDVAPFVDDRGFFTRMFCENEFGQHKLVKHFVQANHSGTYGRGVIRGMHFQHSPFCEVKLVKCVQGAVFDVIIDVREDSPTFLQWFGAELTAENKRMMYVPAGFAHGFQSLTDYSEITYMVSNFYNKESEGGIRYNDEAVKITWPLPASLLSEKDQNIPLIDSGFRGVRL